tara:strand:- start:4118 stop:4516 length:399 start_codon:yes stop_codon:yes gene_type:complete
MKRIDISTFLYILMILIIFVCGTTFSQEFVTTDNFKDKIAKDITVMEFWAGWNESNQFNELNKLNDCNAYRIDIMSYMDIQNEYNVTAIPTIIVFDNGVEKCRFKPNIMFQLEADKKIIQHSVDTITLNKFQ